MLLRTLVLYLLPKRVHVFYLGDFVEFVDIFDVIHDGELVVAVKLVDVLDRWLFGDSSGKLELQWCITSDQTRHCTRTGV